MRLIVQPATRRVMLVSPSRGRGEYDVIVAGLSDVLMTWSAGGAADDAALVIRSPIMHIITDVITEHALQTFIAELLVQLLLCSSDRKDSVVKRHLSVRSAHRGVKPRQAYE